MKSIRNRTGLENFFLLRSDWHKQAIRILVGLSMLSLYFWIASGLFNLMFQLYLSIASGWEHNAEKMIVDVVIILAALELIRTLQSYLELGRVKVTFILDAALVVLIGELIGLWYREYSVKSVVLSLGVIVLLTLLRIITMKFSPDVFEEG